MRQAGFSLAEVVVALGLLGSVLISIAGLLALGNRQVLAGRSRSSALAIAKHLQEELGSVGFHRTYGRFGCEAGARDCLVESGTATAETTALKTMVDAVVTDGQVQILFESLAETGTPPNLEDASAIRMNVIINWRDGLRARNVQLATVRM